MTEPNQTNNELTMADNAPQAANANDGGQQQAPNNQDCRGGQFGHR